jgi:O-antigen/teichoic acid export membrane protein
MSTLIKNILSKDIFRQFSWYAGAQTFLQLASFVNVVIISRYLGPSNVGLLSFVQNYLSFFTAIMIAPDFYFSWQIAKAENKSETLSRYVEYKLTLMWPLFVAGLIGAWVVLPWDVARLATIMMLALLIQPLTAFALYATSTGLAKRFGLVQVSVATFLIVVKMALVLTHAPLFLFAVASMLDVALGTLVIAYLFIREPSWRAALDKVRPAQLSHAFSFLYSIRYSIAAFLAWQYILRIDQLLLATMVNAHSLGIYSAAVKIAEVPNFIGGALYTALIAKMSVVANNEDKISKNNLRRALSIYLSVGAVVMAGVWLGAPILVHILYGAQFVESIPVLRAYALSMPALFAGFFFLAVYGAREDHRFQTGITIGALILNATLLYVLTPRLGLVGAAYSTAIGYTFAVLAFYLHTRTSLINIKA